MNTLEIVLVSISLAMDAFSVSICKGLYINKSKNAFIISSFFGLFQALMPSLGYLMGSNILYLIQNIDHWIIFIFLSIIGINMQKESFQEKEINNRIDFKTLIFLSIATSLDSFAVGLSFSFIEVNIIKAIIYIGIITFILSFVGIKLGNRIGKKFGNYAEFAGGIILVLIGFKILLEHILWKL